MSPTKTASPSHDLFKDDWTVADYQAAQKWEFWYLGLRAHLHEIVNEEHGGANALADFFDHYGLSMEVAGGNISLHSFIDMAPPVPSKSYPQLPVSDLMKRVDAAARMKPMDFPSEDLPQVASALREKAAAFVRLAEQIEAGEFAFPKW